MDGAVLPAAETDELGDLVLHPHSDIPGLWTVMDGEEIVGYVTMFVDDGLGIGHSEAMCRPNQEHLEGDRARVHGLG